MFPDSTHPQSGTASNLPPIQPVVAPVTTRVPQPVPVANVSSTSMSEGSAAAAVTAKAVQLIAQYDHDPHALSEALRQLKMAYLAEQYQISPDLSQK